MNVRHLFLVAALSGVCGAANTNQTTASANNEVITTNDFTSAKPGTRPNRLLMNTSAGRKAEGKFRRGPSSGNIEQYFEGSTTRMDLFHSDNSPTANHSSNSTTMTSKTEKDMIRMYITLAQYVHTVLRRNGYANGILLNMKTATPWNQYYASKVSSMILVLSVLEDKEEISSSSDSEHICVVKKENKLLNVNRSLLMNLEDDEKQGRCSDEFNKGNNNKVSTRDLPSVVDYEVVVDISESKYPPPHASVLEAYRCITRASDQVHPSGQERTKLKLSVVKKLESRIADRSESMSLRSVLYSLYGLGGALIMAVILVALVGVIGVMGVVYVWCSKRKE